MKYDPSWSATTPMSHQLEALSRSIERREFAYFMEQGTGKSKVILDKTVAIFRAGYADGLLVVAPNGVHRNWIVEEAPKHLPLQLSVVSRNYRSGMGKKATEDFEEVFKSQANTFRILAINIEAFSSPGGVKIARRFLDSGRMHMAIDESSWIKTPSAQRTKNLIKLGRFATYRSIATGTPITQGPLDLFAQFEFLRPGYLGVSWTAFKARYAEWVERTTSAGHRFKELVRYRNLDELMDKAHAMSFVITKAECLDLPPVVFERRLVDMYPEQAAAYKMLVKSTLAEFSPTERISTPHMITRLLRLQQIVGGFLPLDGEEVRPMKNAKLDAIMDALEELGDETKVIIWARFIPELRAITAALRAKYGEGCVSRYWGEVDHKERGESVARFQGMRPVLVDGVVVDRVAVPKAEQSRFFVGQQHAAGYGHTLTAGKQVFYFSNDFSLEARLQSEARIHRIGQTASVTCTDFVVEGTIDEKILRALREKQSMADMFTNIREVLNSP